MKIYRIIMILTFFSVLHLIPEVGHNEAIGKKGAQMNHQLEKAIFAGGCFWCMEPPFEVLDGVNSVISGYTGGNQDNPSYQAVASGQTDHYEAVQIAFDPAKIDYETLVKVFFQQIDPTDVGGSFVDRGKQYRSAIFYHDETQKEIASAYIKKLDQSAVFSHPVATKVLAFKSFYPAEAYHQNYYKTNPKRYKQYRSGSGRDAFIDTVWKANPQVLASSSDYTKPPPDVLKARLTPMQFLVTQKEGTEPPFKNDYWETKKPGIYVDIVSGQPLFSSADKFDSGTGWPSFTRPIEPGAVYEKQDKTLFTTRIEVRSTQADSHLGHVFKDGPDPTGLRYCINSAALDFIPYELLESKGLGRFRAQLK